MTPIQYLDAYTLILKENFSSDEIYRYFFLSKNKQKEYPIYDHSITFPLEKWEPNCSSKNLKIVYEDDTLLVVNKPPFILVHSDGNQELNMQDLINAYLYEQGWPHKAQAIHRLDKETSGLLLFCKNPFFQGYYDHLFSDNHPEKEYYALVKKNFPFKEKEVKLGIARDRHNAKKMRVSPAGKDAHSIIKRVTLSKNSTLLKVKILTGKKHQIRVHLSHLGFPILNDSLYGDVINKDGLFLQHYKISLILPDESPLHLELPLDPRIKKNMK